MSPVEVLEVELGGAATEATLQQAVTLLAGALASQQDTNQLRTTGIAAQALSGHRVVSSLADGTFGYPDGEQALNGVLLLTAGAGDAGAPVGLIAEGLVDDPSWSWPVPSTLLLDSLGRISTAPCDCEGVSAPVAVAVSPTRILFRPSTPVALA